MQCTRQKNTGLTLIEMLVVVAIIVIITAVAVPTFVRSGYSLTGRINLAAQEYYTLLRAAQVYATSNNIETAVVYIATPTDSDNDQAIVDSLSGNVVPVVKTMLIARRLTRDELIELGASFVESNSVIEDLGPIYVPLSGSDGTFRDLPNDTCLLPDLFEVDNGESMKGLSRVRVYGPDLGGYYEPIETFDLGGDGDTRPFAAHRFSPEGNFITSDQVTRQRVLVRVGRLPNTLLDERFTADPAIEGEVLDTLEIGYNPTVTPAMPTEYDYIIDANRTPDGQVEDDFHPSRNTLELDRQLELYFSTGRVKVLQ